MEPWKDMEEPSIHIVTVKEANLKRLLLYDFNYTTFWKRQDHKNNEKLVTVWTCGEGRGEALIGGALGNFRAVTSLCVIL